MREGVLESTPISHESRPELESDMAGLWKKYRFPGEPPPPGSVGEQRMRKYAEQYISATIGITTTSRVSAEVRAASDSTRRNLHNQLAIMIYGEMRSGMPQRLATKICDFAAELVHPGMTLEDLSSLARADEPT